MTAKLNYKKLNPSVKEKWLKALRSGKYKQSKGYLCDPYGYCCLGVLAKIKNKLDETDDTGYDFGSDLAQNGTKLKAKEKLVTCSTFVPNNWVDYTAQLKLVKMNDRGRSFKYIAAWIEKML